MKRHILYYTLLITLILTGCEEDELHMPLNITDSLSFSGTFKTVNSENISGTLTLSISNGYYECWTNLPYGHGAGKLEVNNKQINFIDTLFFAVPAIYGPSYVLSGMHYYEYDGEELKIRKEKNIGSVEYDLKLTGCENSHYGILRYLTGFDGCGWIIQLSESIKLEPINLEDFEIELIDNKPVCVRFHERDDLGSYCMVGKVVELDFVE